MNKVERFGHFMIGIAFMSLYTGLLIMLTWTIRNTNMIFIAMSNVMISQYILPPVAKWSTKHLSLAFTGIKDYLNRM